MKKSRDYWRIQFLGNNSKKTDTQNILRIIIDHKLDFKEKIKDLSNDQMTRKKLNALTKSSDHNFMSAKPNS